jgi:hypothetical protein
MIASTLPASPIEQALRHSPIPPLRKLGLEENDSEVVLSGSVSSYYLKQLAQEAILPLIGQRNLHNRVAVVRQK